MKFSLAAVFFVKRVGFIDPIAIARAQANHTVDLAKYAAAPADPSLREGVRISRAARQHRRRESTDWEPANRWRGRAAFRLAAVGERNSGVAPVGVRRIRARFPTATEFGEVSVSYLSANERGGERFAIELRVALRARKTADVGDEFDFIEGEEVEEDFDRAGGVADGPDGFWHLRRSAAVSAVGSSGVSPEP